MPADLPKTLLKFLIALLKHQAENLPIQNIRGGQFHAAVCCCRMPKPEMQAQKPL